MNYSNEICLLHYSSFFSLFSFLSAIFSLYLSLPLALFFIISRRSSPGILFSILRFRFHSHLVSLLLTHPLCPSFPISLSISLSVSHLSLKIYEFYVILLVYLFLYKKKLLKCSHKIVVTFPE